MGITKLFYIDRALGLRTLKTTEPQKPAYYNMVLYLQR